MEEPSITSFQRLVPTRGPGATEHVGNQWELQMAILCFSSSSLCLSLFFATTLILVVPPVKPLPRCNSPPIPLY